MKTTLIYDLLRSIFFMRYPALLVSMAILAATNLVMGEAGTLDPTFGIGRIVATANIGAESAAFQSDGKLVVAGSIAAVRNQQQGGLMRYNTNGALDFGFGIGGKVLIDVGASNAGAAFAVAIQTDGKILAAAPASLRLRIFRFNTNGSLDLTFGTNGAVTIQAVGLFLPPASGGMVLQPDGRILVATGRIATRLLANGQLDLTFGFNGAAPTVGGDSIALLSNGNILVAAGSVASLYAPNGSLVTNFDVNGETSSFAF